METAWISDYLKSNGNELFFTRTGGNKPPIVLAHGFTDDGSCWTDVAMALQNDYDLVMYDAIGHGQSSRIAEDTSLDMIADMHNIIIGLDLKKPAIIGHSMGAATAAGYAAIYPENVSAIILEDVPWFNEMHAPRKEEKTPFSEVIADLQKGPLKDAIAYSKLNNCHFADSVHEPWASSKLKFDLALFNRKWPEKKRWQEIAGKIACPTLLLTGDIEKGALVTPKLAIEALRLMPDLQWAHIPGAGHCIRYERFSTTINVIKTYLKMKYPSKK
jgi:N-formylmaleamate deformylase